MILNFKLLKSKLYDQKYVLKRHQNVEFKANQKLTQFHVSMKIRSHKTSRMTYFNIIHALHIPPQFEMKKKNLNAIVIFLMSHSHISCNTAHIFCDKFFMLFMYTHIFLAFFGEQVNWNCVKNIINNFQFLTHIIFFLGGLLH